MAAVNSRQMPQVTSTSWRQGQLNSISISCCTFTGHSDSYILLAAPWFVVALVWEAITLHYIVHPSRHLRSFLGTNTSCLQLVHHCYACRQPLHLPRLNDTINSLSLGILNQLVTTILFIQVDHIASEEHTRAYLYHTSLLKHSVRLLEADIVQPLSPYLTTLRQNHAKV